MKRCLPETAFLRGAAQRRKEGQHHLLELKIGYRQATGHLRTAMKKRRVPKQKLLLIKGKASSKNREGWERQKCITRDGSVAQILHLQEVVPDLGAYSLPKYGFKHF